MNTVKYDEVNHPAHYMNGTMETIDAIEGFLTKDEFVGYLKGNMMKYVSRYQNKGGLTDLHKAEWYLTKLFMVEENRSRDVD